MCLADVMKDRKNQDEKEVHAQHPNAAEISSHYRVLSSVVISVLMTTDSFRWGICRIYIFANRI